MAEGAPIYNMEGEPRSYPNGTLLRQLFHMSDIDIARALFSVSSHHHDADHLYWPGVEDARHGYVPGLRLLPDYASMSDTEFAAESMIGKRRRTIAGEGFQRELWDGTGAVWRALDVRYDQCVGNCECLPGRDMREGFITIHFSCFQSGIRKPGFYETERELMHEMYWRASR